MPGLRMVSAALPFVTATFAVEPEIDHGPPTSAVPSPPETVRPNASETNGPLAGGGWRCGAVTVTARLVVVLRRRRR